MPDRSNIVAMDAARIEAEAAAWVARLDGEEVTKADRAAFYAWCNLSDQHLTAAEQLAELWSAMDLLGKASSEEPQLATPSSNAQGQVPFRS